MIPAPALPNYTPTGARTSPLRRFLWRSLFILLFLGIVGGALGATFYHLAAPPDTFPTQTELIIEEGLSTTKITENLYEAGYIRSPFVLYLILSFFHDPRDVKASTYIFSQPLSAFALAERLMLGDYGNDLVRFVHYEGESRMKLAARASAVLRGFDEETFLRLTEGQEGKLFPDTYLLPKVYSAEALAELLRETYEVRISPLRPAIIDSQLNEDEVVILASILEREANSAETKRMVAGILLKRLEIGMPLQVDASIEYVLDKPLNELTAADLDRESPYNTYLNDGLPPTPIGNPGLTAIQAVLEPTPSPYIFYLTGNDGNFYYATTNREHERNIALYLR